MSQAIIFIGLIIIVLVILVSLLVKLVIEIIRKTKTNQNTKVFYIIKRKLVALIISMAILIIFVGYTQLTATTPTIKDENDNLVENSISELQRVTINGHKEWISIRGYDKSAPVILFLAGGPGGSQMAAVRHDLAELEKHFVIVNWDQAGSAKSFGAVGNSEITPDTYINDGFELTKYLCERFNKDKIYLIGESWGSALGIFMIDKAPELYHAFIGTGQMIDFAQTEILDYQKALEIAEENGDTEKIEKLELNGVPPYYGDDITFKSAEYLSYLSDYMSSNPEIHNSGYNTLRDLFSSEYGIVDKINYFRGVITTFNNVYQQLYDIDLREDYTKLNVPVYFFLGRYDINAPTELVEEYFEILDASNKKIIWFEHSGHSPWINESDAFIDEVLKVFDD